MSSTSADEQRPKAKIFIGVQCHRWPSRPQLHLIYMDLLCVYQSHVVRKQLQPRPSPPCDFLFRGVPISEEQTDKMKSSYELDGGRGADQNTHLKQDGEHSQAICEVDSLRHTVVLGVHADHVHLQRIAATRRNGPVSGELSSEHQSSS